MDNIPTAKEYTSTLEAFNDGFKTGHYTCEKYHQDREKEVAIDFGRYLESQLVNFERWGFEPEMFDQYLESKK